MRVPVDDRLARGADVPARPTRRKWRAHSRDSVPRPRRSAITRHYLTRWIASAAEPRLGGRGEPGAPSTAITPMDQRLIVARSTTCAPCIRRSGVGRSPFTRRHRRRHRVGHATCCVAGPSRVRADAVVIHSHDRSAPLPSSAHVRAAWAAVSNCSAYRPFPPCRRSCASHRHTPRRRTCPGPREAPRRAAAAIAGAVRWLARGRSVNTSGGRRAVRRRELATAASTEVV